MSKLKDILNKMMDSTVRKTQAPVGGMGGNATVMAKCVHYDPHRKLCTIYDPIGKEPQQRFRGDDGNISMFETIQGGRTVKIPWQPVDGGEDREDPGMALEEFHMLGTRDLGDVKPEQLYDYIEMITAIQRVNKGTSRFLRMIVDQRKFVGGSGGGINRHWVPQIIVEVQYDMEGWPDTARATRIIESCPIPTQRPTANSVPSGDPIPYCAIPDGEMYFDRARFASEADWLLESLGSLQRPSQASDTPRSASAAATSGGTGDASSAGGGGGGGIPPAIAASSNRALITVIDPISISGGGVSTSSGSITNEYGGGADDSTEVAIADGVVLPTISRRAITDPTSSDTWDLSNDPVTGSPRLNRYRSFGLSSPQGAASIPAGVCSTSLRLQNPIKQKHLLGVSHLFDIEMPWITIHTSYKGVPIHACSDGIVRFAGYSALFKCYTIVIEHAQNIVSVYTYCIGPSVAVRKGQHVHEDQIIALLDSSDEGILMRFGVFSNFNPVDPLNYIKGWKRMRRI